MAAFPSLSLPLARRLRRGEVAPDQAELARLAKAHDWETIVSLTEALDPRSRDPAAIGARLARVEALRKLGRAAEALPALEATIRRHGPSSEMQESLAASLSLFGRHHEALEALRAASAVPPGEDRGGRSRRRLALLSAEELIHLGRNEEACETVIAALDGAVPSHGEMSLLRRTVVDARSLNRLFTILSPIFSQPGATATNSLFQWSMACRDGGEPALAISAARARFLKMVHAVPFGGVSTPAPSPNWLAEAQTALGDLVHDLGRIGERPFLVSGTFLGCVREGGIIGHDKDVDLGLLSEADTATLRRKIGATGRFAVRPEVTDRLVQVVHANRVVVDIFLHWRENGRILHAGQKGCWWNSAFALSETEFLGVRVSVPDPAEPYLTENYGTSWRTPDPEFETFLDTPNIIMPGENHMRWYYFTKLADFYRAGKLAKIERVWARLSPLIGSDRAARAAIDRARAEADLATAQ